MIIFGKPFFQIWYLLEHYLAKIPHHSIRKLDTVMIVIVSSLFLGFLRLQNDLAINVDRISVIVIVLLILFLVKRFWFSDQIEQDPIEQKNVYRIFPLDFLALEHFVKLLVIFATLAFLLVITGQFWVSLIVAGFLALRIDFVVGGEDEVAWKIILDNDDVVFDNGKRTARLRLAKVSEMRVYLAYNQPKKIVFEMGDAQLHEIKHYRHMDEILNYCSRIVPKSKTRWISYT